MQDLEPQPGTEPLPPAVEAESPNPRTARRFFFFKLLLTYFFKENSNTSFQNEQWPTKTQHSQNK